MQARSMSTSSRTATTGHGTNERVVVVTAGRAVGDVLVGRCLHMGTMASNGLRIMPSRAMSFGFFRTVLLSRRLHVREEFVGSRYGVGDLVFFGQTATSDQIYSLEAARWSRTKRFRALTLHKNLLGDV